MSSNEDSFNISLTDRQIVSYFPSKIVFPSRFGYIDGTVQCQVMHILRKIQRTHFLLDVGMGKIL